MRSYELSGSSSNKGYILIDNQIYNLPADINLEEGFHIISYDPELDYHFCRWELSGIENASPGGELDNPTVISISSPGEVRAFYELGPQLDISRPYELMNAIFTDAPIKLKVRVTSDGKPVPDAKVTFYVSSTSIGYNKTDGDGYSSISFVPIDEKMYKWYATAEKKNYASGTSDEWKFAFQKLKLDPSDDDILTNLPIYLNTLVELDREPVEAAWVSFFVDNEKRGSRPTQLNGYASLKLDDITVGVHSWYVSAYINGWGTILSENQSFAYFPEISAVLINPINGEDITDFASTVTLEALVTSGNEPIQGVNVSFFVMGSFIGFNISDSKGVASFNFSPPKEDETYDWCVTASKTSLLNDTSPTWSFHYPVQPPYIEVDEISTSKSRADINSEQTIGFHLRWGNGSNVRGANIRITDNHEGITDDSGWATFPVSSSNVGEKFWKIIDVSCEGMKEFRHNHKYPKIIWDRIIIELGIDKNRIDVGTTVEPEVRAFYEYDKTKFDGSIFYNAELYSDKVCEKIIKVNGIQDHKYYLSAFQSNEINVIWDRVLISLEIPSSRIEIGSEPNILYDGIYEYDGRPFKGSVIFENDLTQYYIGEKKVTVSNISDSLYDLSIFQSNEVSFFFDDIKIEQNINTMIPTQVKILTTVFYKSDNKPVYDASVKVNGIGENTGSGEYKSTIYTFYPSSQLTTEIKLNGFKDKVIKKNIFSISNIIFESTLLTIIGTIIIRKKYYA